MLFFRPKTSKQRTTSHHTAAGVTGGGTIGIDGVSSHQHGSRRKSDRSLDGEEEQNRLNLLTEGYVETGYGDTEGDIAEGGTNNYGSTLLHKDVVTAADEETMDLLTRGGRRFLEAPDTPVVLKKRSSHGHTSGNMPKKASRAYRARRAFAASLRKTTNSSALGHTSSSRAMAVLPGKSTRMVLDIFCFLLCLSVMILQLGVLDYYFVTHLESKWWYAWIAGDVAVVLIMIWLLVIAVRYNQRCMEEACTSDANVKYAFIGWLAYSSLLAGKIAVTFRLYYTALSIDRDELFGRHLFRLTLSLSALVFLLLVEAHHYTRVNSPRHTYLSYLSSVVTLDILDSIFFLDLLWQSQSSGWALKQWMEIGILVLACGNFILPTFALLRLRFKKLPGWVLLPYEKLYSLIYVLMVNLPYLAIRVYLFVVIKQDRGGDYDASVFAIKNVIMIYIAIRELWTRLHYCRSKRQAAKDGRDQLTSNENASQ